MSRRAILRFGVPAALVLALAGIYFVPSVVAFIYEVIAFFAPLWLPVLLLSLAYPLWLRFARSQFVGSVPYTTIELKPGPETPRSAKPMELVFYLLYHRIDLTKRDFLLGRVRLPWSFEVYVHHGNIRFFVHLPKSQRAAVEGRIQSEYRDVEITEVRDYSREIMFDPLSMRADIREYTLIKPDPYPLKTYEDYEKQAVWRDLFSEMLEEVALMGEHEHFLVSYLIRPHQRERTSYFADPRDTLHEDAHRVIADILGPHGDLTAVSPTAQKVIGTIEQALKKPSFDCGIRALYIAHKEAFNELHARALDTLFDRFNDPDLNGFVAYHPVERSNALASELFALSSSLASEHFVRLFRRRAFFAPPYEGNAFILNTEELATVFHLPHALRGSALLRRHGITLEPPVNLPI